MEHVFDAIGRQAGTVIVDQETHPSGFAGEGQASPGAVADGVLDEVVERPAQRGGPAVERHERGPGQRHVGAERPVVLDQVAGELPQVHGAAFPDGVVP